jgi:PEGA domain/NHL repeat
MADLKTKNGTKFWAFVLIGACLFYLSAADFSFSQADSPKSFIQDGKQLLEKGDFGPSLEKLAKAEAFLKSGPGEPSPEKLAEVYFYQGLNYGSQGQAGLAKDLFKKALRAAPNKAFDTSAMNPETKKIFGDARKDIEKENGPRAMGTAGAPAEGRHSSTVAWVVLGIVVVAAAAVAAYFIFFKKGEGDVNVDSDPQGAKVYLDGADTNKTTPCSLSNLKEGEHTLKMTKADFGEWEGKVEIKKNEKINISQTLTGYKYQNVATYTTPVYIEASGGIDLDRSRNIYYTSQQLGGGYGHVHKFSSSGSYIEAKNTGRHESLHGLAIDTSGSEDYFITTDRVYWNLVFRFNWAGTYSISWGGPVNGGSGNGQFNGPEAVAVDSSGNIYVADKNNNRIQKFNSSGTFLITWGGSGSGSGQFSKPEGIAVDSSNYVYVADTGNNRVQKFSSTGSFVTAWGSSGSGNGQFVNPDAIDVNPNGGVFVIDNTRTQKFTTNGGYLTQFGTSGTDLVADDLGNVFILYGGNITKWSITSTISREAATRLNSLSLTGNPKDSFRLFIPASSERPANSILKSSVQQEQKTRLEDKK